MDKNGRDRRLALLARRQAGTFGHQQLIDIGFTKATIARRAATGAWERIHSGVYGFPEAPDNRLRSLWSATLAVGAPCALSHETAALIHGAERLPEHPIVLTNPHRWHHAIEGLFVHQIDDLLPREVVTWKGLPVTSPARCVVELGATQPVGIVGRVADDLIAMNRTSLRKIESVFQRVVRPGKPGMLTIARVLDERADGDPIGTTELERTLYSVLEAGGLPRPARQIPLPGRGRARGIVDAGYPHAALLIEADGRRWHARVHAARQDRARDAQAAAAGWQTLRFGYQELNEAPAWVCEVVGDTLAMRRGLANRVA